MLLVLRAPEAARLLVIETGVLEGRAIALEAGGVRSERPLTQDLLHETIAKLGARVKEARIDEFRDDLFYARVVLTRVDNGRDVELDCRPSDAVALALRAGAPILVADEVLAEVGEDEQRDGRFAELYTGEDEEEPPEGHLIH